MNPHDSAARACRMPSRRTFFARLSAAIAAGAGAPLFAPAASAQDTFPSRNIEIVVPWGVGGGPSQIAEKVRAIANKEHLSPRPVAITHKPGASGLVGTALVADQRGNPHVFMPGGGALLAQAVMGETPVHPLRDLTPLALSAVDASLLVVAADSPYRNIGEIVTQLKKTPKSVTLASAGGGASSWDGVVATVFGAIAGVEFNVIPFAGGAEVQAAVLGRQIDVGSRALSNAEALIAAGQLRALVVFDAARNPKLPGVPTMRELGYDVTLNLSRGWFAPAGLKPEAVQWYADFFRRIDADATWQKYVEQTGLQRRYLGPVEWAAFIDNSMKTIATLYRKVGILK
jgi:putative tricarboxylic transport membrane protein